MKKLFAIVLLVASFATAQAQKTIKDVNAEKRNVSGYKAISVGGGIDLYLSQGDESVAVSASETKFRDRIKTEVVNGVLKIWYDYKGDILRGNKKLKAYVSFSTLEKLSGGGGSDIIVDGAIKVAKLQLIVSGGSDFHGKVEIDELAVDASGGSDVDISGTATKLIISASGGSDVNGYGLSADVCKLDASGGSDVHITVNKELTAEASGGSDVFYKGNAVLNLRTSGSSSVKKTS